MTESVVSDAAEQIVDAYPDLDTGEVVDLLEGLIEDAETEKDGFTYDELRENLPGDIHEAVMNHLNGGPESAREVAIKAVMGEGTPVNTDTSPPDESVAERVRKADTDESPSLNTVYRFEEDVE
jgi:hypothetical protein